MRTMTLGLMVLAGCSFEQVETGEFVSGGFDAEVTQLDSGQEETSEPEEDSGVDEIPAYDPEPELPECADVAPGDPSMGFGPAMDCDGTAPCTGALHYGEPTDSYCKWTERNRPIGLCASLTMWGTQLPQCNVQKGMCAMYSGPDYCAVFWPGRTARWPKIEPSPAWLVSLVAPIGDADQWDCPLECPLETE